MDCLGHNLLTRQSLIERAMALITEGMREKSKKKMQEADVLLQLAAGAGNAEAAEYLADLWPSLKARAQSYQ